MLVYVCVIPTNHAPETGAKNQLHFSSAGFWSVCHANLWPDSSGTRNWCWLEHCSISKPESGVRITEMMIYSRLLFIFCISCKQSVNSRVVIYLFIVIYCFCRLQPRLFLRQKFSFRTYMVQKTGVKNRRRKMESIYGASFWGVFHGCNARAATNALWVRHIFLPNSNHKFPILTRRDRPTI